jgi:hypothetical protein
MGSFADETNDFRMEHFLAYGIKSRRHATKRSSKIREEREPLLYDSSKSNPELLMEMRNRTQAPRDFDIRNK